MSGSAQLNASLVLRLDDKLSAGLAKIQAQMEKFRRITGRLQLRGMNQARVLLDRLSGATDTLQDKLRRMGGVARTAMGSISALGDRIVYIARDGTAAIGRLDAAMDHLARPRALMLAGPGGGGGGGPAMPRLLGGPDEPFDGRIPLNYRAGPSWGGIGAGAAAYGRNVLAAGRGVGHATEGAAAAAMGAIAGGFGFIEPLREAAQFDKTLRHIAIGLNLTGKAGDEMVKALGLAMQDLALKTGQTSESLTDAAGYFSREGYSLSEIKEVLPQIAKISTAYNAAPEDVAKTAFALKENIGIASSGDLAKALAGLAIAGKKSDLKFEELAPLFPQVAPMAGIMGETGLEGAQRVSAMLAESRKNAGSPGEAVTNFNRFMGDISSPFAARHFAQMGVNLPGVIADAKKKGIDPMEAVLSKVAQLTKGGTDNVALGKLFHNQESRQFVIAMLKHMDEYKAIMKAVKEVDAGMIDRDFVEGQKALNVQLAVFGETLHQLVVRIGYGFVPALKVATVAMLGLVAGMRWMDHNFPHVLPVVLSVVAGLLALTTVLGLLGAAAPMVASGWRLFIALLGPFGPLVERLGGSLLRLLNPFRLLGGAARVLVMAMTAIGVPFEAAAAVVAFIAAVLIGAAIDIIEHWSKFKGFFEAIGHGIHTAFDGIGEFIVGVFTIDPAKITGGLSKAWAGLKESFGGLMGIIRGVFNDALAKIEALFGNLPGRLLNALTAKWTELTGGVTNLVSGLQKDFDNSWLGRKLGLADHDATAGGAGASDGKTTHEHMITLRAEPGTKVTGVRSNSPTTQWQMPDNGPMLVPP